MAGYSPKSLVDKLGLKAVRKDGQSVRALFISVPSDYAETLGPLPRLILRVDATADKAGSKVIVKRGPFDFIQAFCKEENELAELLPALKAMLAIDGMLWVCWPKKIKGLTPAEGALSEAQARELGLKTGLVDVKVCAVDEIWSGLKFMFRLKDRP